MSATSSPPINREAPLSDPLPAARSSAAPLVLLTVLACLAASFFARPILAPVSFALFAIAVVWPLHRRLQSRLPALAALGATVGVSLATLALGVFLALWAFGHVAQWLIANNNRFQTLFFQAADWLDGHGVPAKALMSNSFSPSWIATVLREIGGHGYGLISFFLVAFTFFLLGLLEVELCRDNLKRLDGGLGPKIHDAAVETAQKFQRYMLVRSAMSGLTGAVVWIFALTAGVELATAWGVLAFVLNYIPFIGPLIATVFPSLFALAQSESWRLAIAVFAGLNVIQFFIGSYLEPRVAGKTLAMSPFMVLFAVFFWSFLWGVVGAFIGVPILIAALTICAQSPSSRWLATLLGGQAASGGSEGQGSAGSLGSN